MCRIKSIKQITACRYTLKNKIKSSNNIIFYKINYGKHLKHDDHDRRTLAGVS